MKKIISSLLAATMLLTSFATITHAATVSITPTIELRYVEYSPEEYADLEVTPEELREYHVYASLKNFGTLDGQLNGTKNIVSGRRLMSIQLDAMVDKAENVSYSASTSTIFPQASCPGFSTAEIGPDPLDDTKNYIRFMFKSDTDLGAYPKLEPGSITSATVDNLDDFFVFDVEIDEGITLTPIVTITINNYSTEGTGSRMSQKAGDIETANELSGAPLYLYGVGEGPAAEEEAINDNKEGGQEFTQPIVAETTGSYGFAKINSVTYDKASYDYFVKATATNNDTKEWNLFTQYKAMNGDTVIEDLIKAGESLDNIPFYVVVKSNLHTISKVEILKRAK